MKQLPPLSVIVCSSGERPLLWDTLRSLVAQDLPDLEVILVDNSTTGTLEADIQAHGLSFAVRYSHCPEAGSSPARNLGASLASSPRLAFTDDDILFPPSWARHMAAGLDQHPKCGIVAGRTLPDWEDPPPAWAVRSSLVLGLLSAPDFGPAERILPPKLAPVCANMGISKEAFLAAGGFDSSLGRGPGSLVSFEERALVERSGRRAVYCPAAAGHHRIHANRVNRSWLVERARAEGRSLRIWDRGRSERMRRLKLLALRSGLLPLSPIDTLLLAAMQEGYLETRP